MFNSFTARRLHGIGNLYSPRLVAHNNIKWRRNVLAMPAHSIHSFISPQNVIAKKQNKQDLTINLTRQNRNNYSSSLSSQFVLCIFTTHSMQNRVYETVRCLSVRLSPSTDPQQQTSCCRFAAGPGEQAISIDRLLHAAGECGQCHVVSVRRYSWTQTFVVVTLHKMQRCIHKTTAW